MTDLAAFESKRQAIVRNNRLAHLCWFAKLKPEQQQLLNEARAAGYSGQVIASVVQEEWGVTIQRSQVNHHFRGTCSCE